MEGTRPTIVMAGATGFVGTRLRMALKKDYNLICLTRSAVSLEQQSRGSEEVWRACDLFSLLELEDALKGADYAIYLVHSMLPSARLMQGTFADLDLIMADNFARAAQHNGLKQILYLGGLIPEVEDLSPHLASRLEVEKALASGTTPVTTLRAGLIVGPGGSSFRIVVNLVNRLPFMTLPGWTRTRTQPIAVADVLRAFFLAIGNTAFYGNHYDIGGPDVMTYRDMLHRTARVLGRKPILLNVPFFSPRLSTLWVSLFGGASRALVGPLVESLRHPMIAEPNALQTALGEAFILFEDSLRASLDDQGRLLPNPRDRVRPMDDKLIRQSRRVRSVQRMNLPPHKTARWVMEEYYRWLPRVVRPFLRCHYQAGGKLSLSVISKRWRLIEFTKSLERSTEDRQLLYITGGLLAQTHNNRKGRIEFREILDRRCVLAAIHDYVPSLPWYLYSKTQALFHLYVMWRFKGHLKTIQDEDGPKAH